MANLSRTGTCAEDGCDQPIHARLLCKLHYSRQYRQRNPEKMRRYRDQRRTGYLRTECVRCGNPVPAERRQYCTARCQKKGEKERAKARGYERRTAELVCFWCDRSYRGEKQPPGRASWATYCSAECLAAGHSWKKGQHVCLVNWHDCSDCGAKFIRRRRRTRCDPCRQAGPRKPEPSGNARWIAGYCAECGDAFVCRGRYGIRFCCTRCKNAAKGRDYAAKKRTAFVERVFRRKVFQRDGYVCQICRRPTSARWTEGDPLAPTLDHIQPINKGGEHSYANTQCAHAVCNSRKQDNVDDHVQLRLAA